MSDKKTVKCLECHADIEIEADVQKGEVVTCSECSSDFEIVGTDPVEITKAPEAQEDWGE